MAFVFARTNEHPELDAIKRRDAKIMFYIERAITNPSDRYPALNTRRHRKSDNDLTQKQMDELKEFLTFMQQRGLKPLTQYNYVGKLAAMVREVQKAPSELETNDYAEYFAKSTQGNKAAVMKAAYLYYVKFKRQSDKFTDLMEGVGKAKKNNKKKSARDMLTQEKLNQLLRAANNYRDKAFIGVLFETGCRISEFLSIRMKDIDFSAKNKDVAAPVYVTIRTSKTDEGVNRVVRIVNSYPLLAKYLELEHAYRNTPNFKKSDYPLWCDRFKNCMLRSTAYKMLQLTAARADLGEFKVYNHLFRASRVYDLRYNWHLEWEEIRELMGHKSINTTIGHYFAINQDEIDRKLTKGSSESKDDREKRIAEYIKKVSPRWCINCDRELHATAEFCDNCGTPCDVQTAEKIVKERQAEKETLMEEMARELRKKLLAEMKAWVVEGEHGQK